MKVKKVEHTHTKTAQTHQNQRAYKCVVSITLTYLLIWRLLVYVGLGKTILYLYVNQSMGVLK